MEIGLIGLGRMGGNMRERIRRAGHTVVGYDRNPDVSDVDSLQAMVDALPAPKVVWVMVPAGDPTRATIEDLKGLLSEGDIVIVAGVRSGRPRDQRIQRHGEPKIWHRPARGQGGDGAWALFLGREPDSPERRSFTDPFVPSSHRACRDGVSRGCLDTGSRHARTLLDTNGGGAEKRI